MHVSVTRVKTGDQPIENATIVAEEMAGWLDGVEGFEGLVVLSQEGTSLGLTFWANEEVAERQRPVRMQFLERITSIAGLEVEDISFYDVTFARLGPGFADSLMPSLRSRRTPTAD